VFQKPVDEAARFVGAARTRAYALHLLQIQASTKDFLDKTGVQSRRQPLAGYASLAGMTLEQRQRQTPQ
jgi:hypothetical protein